MDCFCVGNNTIPPTDSRSQQQTMPILHPRNPTAFGNPILQDEARGDTIHSPIVSTV